MEQVLFNTRSGEYPLDRCYMTRILSYHHICVVCVLMMYGSYRARVSILVILSYALYMALRVVLKTSYKLLVKTSVW